MQAWGVSLLETPVPEQMKYDSLAEATSHLMQVLNDPEHITCLLYTSYVVAPLMLYIFGCGIYTAYRQTWNQFFILLVAEFCLLYTSRCV